MSSNAAEWPAPPREIDTGELLKLAGCSRNVLARIRRQYTWIRPVRRLGHGLLLWSSDTADAVRQLVNAETEK